ncbi:MAG: DinB family protein [Chloroflexia bacterium]|nr:DinB family protein [Chloroflexia bacterium]MDQ3411393.1 DinB family protein [Chloroflexota bacterium]
MEPTVKTAREHLKLTRDAYRETIRGMDQAALNWTPGPDTNSAAVLVVHIAGSEGELLRTIRGLPTERDRDAEFRATAGADAELLAKLDEMDAFFEEMAPHITADDLASPRTRWNGTTNTGLYWLLHDVSHLREHLGHIQLTNQLYERRSTR